MYFFSLALSVFATMIGPVEYILPERAKEWVTVRSTESGPEQTVIFAPSKEASKEAFIVSRYQGPSSIKDDIDIQKTLSERFPGLQADVTVLSREKESLLYEFTIKDVQGKLVVYGISRLFALPNEVVVLNFSTEEEASITEGKALWEPVLKSATFQP